MDEMGMPADQVTIAEVLKPRGYHTIHLGKWHLGEAAGMRPEAQGFDESLGFMPGAAKYEPDTAVSAKLPGDPLDRLLWMAATDAVQYQWRPALSRRRVSDRLFQPAGGRGDQGQPQPAVLPLPRLQRPAHAVPGHEERL